MVVGDVVQNKGGGKMVISVQWSQREYILCCTKGISSSSLARQIGTLQSYN